MNVLCSVKRFEAYETVGALFRESFGTLSSCLQRTGYGNWHWTPILEIAEIISADASELLSAVIDTNSKFRKLFHMYKLVV